MWVNWDIWFGCLVLWKIGAGNRLMLCSERPSKSTQFPDCRQELCMWQCARIKIGIKVKWNDPWTNWILVGSWGLRCNISDRDWERSLRLFGNAIKKKKKPCVYKMPSWRYGKYELRKIQREVLFVRCKRCAGLEHWIKWTSCLPKCWKLLRQIILVTETPFTSKQWDFIHHFAPHLQAVQEIIGIC